MNKKIYNWITEEEQLEIQRISRENENNKDKLQPITQDLIRELRRNGYRIEAQKQLQIHLDKLKEMKKQGIRENANIEKRKYYWKNREKELKRMKEYWRKIKWKNKEK